MEPRPTEAVSQLGLARNRLGSCSPVGNAVCPLGDAHHVGPIVGFPSGAWHSHPAQPARGASRTLVGSRPRVGQSKPAVLRVIDPLPFLVVDGQPLRSCNLSCVRYRSCDERAHGQSGWWVNPPSGILLGDDSLDLGNHGRALGATVLTSILHWRSCGRAAGSCTSGARSASRGQTPRARQARIVQALRESKSKQAKKALSPWERPRPLQLVPVLVVTGIPRTAPAGGRRWIPPCQR